MDAREFKALELAAKAKIEWRKTYWYVPSVSHNGGHRVNHEVTECSCEDYELRRLPCKHILAVRFVKGRTRNAPLPEPKTETGEPVPPPKRPTYRQQWSQYNAAQTHEKDKFLELLADLCRGIQWMPRGGRGRPRVPYPDAIFAAVFKVYSTFSGRRFMSDMRAARDRGHVAAAPHYNSIFRVLEDPTVTPTLKSLVIRSSLPLRVVETAFACDSTGFSTNKFARWYDEKYGVARKRHEFVKCHAMAGVKSNVIVAADVNDAGDAPMFRQLALTAAQNFRVDEFSADKAYSSFANLEFAEELGATPYIAFKVNSRGDTRPGIWERMHAHFTLRRDDYLKHYHKRSNVESTFGAIKRKFGDYVRSKTETAIKNEVLCKVVCHNLVVVIHEMYELGINPGFTVAPPVDDENGPLNVVRFPGA